MIVVREKCNFPAQYSKLQQHFPPPLSGFEELLLYLTWHYIRVSGMNSREKGLFKYPSYPTKHSGTKFIDVAQQLMSGIAKYPKPKQIAWALGMMIPGDKTLIPTSRLTSHSEVKIILYAEHITRFWKSHQKSRLRSSYDRPHISWLSCRQHL
jgi:hypothetical protein